MREIALHILDVVENSLRARATIVAVRVAVEPDCNRMEVLIEDNGPGLPVAAEQAADPFYTTKTGKRTGLGLTLFRDTAEQAGGTLVIGKGPMGGVRVRALMRLDHVDRLPLGDLAGTFAGLALTNPEVEFRFELALAGQSARVSTAELAAAGDCDAFALAQGVKRIISAELDRAVGLIGMAL